MTLRELAFVVSLCAAASFLPLSQGQAAPATPGAAPKAPAVEYSGAPHWQLVDDDDDDDGHGRGRWRRWGDGDRDDWRDRRRFYGYYDEDREEWRRRQARRQWCFYHPGYC